jgi:serine phosphatase RsbU (regulator of sigma subunit)
MALRGRVVVSALAGVLVLVLLSASLAWRQYGDTRDTALNGVRARAVLAASILDTYFTGQVGTLQAMAAAPAVVSTDLTAMDAYLKRVQSTAGKGFTGGIGWVDSRGVSRVSSTGTAQIGDLSVADRSYFKTVMATGKPFVSEGITTRRGGERAVVVAVPTRDAAGKLTGMLAGALLIKPTPTSKASIDLGFAGIAIFDRTGQSVLNGFVKPRNPPLLGQLRKTPTGGVVGSTRGLDGKADHVVGYATAAVPAWVIAIDQPRSAVLASARRSLHLALGLIAGVASLVLLLVVRSVRRARRDAERRDTLARQQHELAGALASASAVQDVSQALARSLAAAFPGALAVVALAADDRLGVRIAATAGGAFDRSVHGSAVTQAAEDAHLTGAPVAHHSESQLRDRAPEVSTAFAGAVGSSYAVPLIAPDGDRVGALVVLFGGEHPLDAGEQALLATQAGQAAIAIQRTRERERDHEATVRLQRSLLPDRLPEIDGLDLVARYNAGGTGLEIGGDWYDVVHRSDGLVHLTVGDVAGRGIGAAALMGQLRNAFRAYALDHTSPADVMQRLLRHVGDDEMATAVVVTLDLRSGELRYASAGHPPPLVVEDRTGAVSLLDLPPAPPLGAPESGVIEEGLASLLPGSTIVLYTDGLIEHRGSSIDDGIAAVVSALAANATLPPGALADVVLERAGAEADLADDIALLVVRFSGVPAPAAGGPTEPGSMSVFGTGG